jgi:hypothetical protein
LNTDGVVRCTAFAGKLVFCNGYDDLMSWDGSGLAVVEEYVVDASAGLAYVSGTQFTIESEAGLYAVGTKVQAQLAAGVFVESTVAGVSQSGDVTSVTLHDSVLTSALSQVAYGARPPRAAFVYATHDRLWAFGKGPLLSAGLSGDVDRMRVYYTFGVNDVTAWHDADGNWQGINLADKNPLQDELLAMSVKDNMTVFFGRRQTQVWTGSDPSVGGDMSWSKTLPLGVVHGEAVLELPNDVAFLSDNGMRTLSRSLQTEQLDVSDVGSELDPTWLEVVREIQADTAAYRKLRRGACEAQGWLGLSVPGRTLVLQVTSGGPVWAVFDGLFGSADAVGNLPDGQLLLAVENRLYKYDDTVWNDAGMVFTCRWWTPWAAPAGVSRRWGNCYISVLTAKQATLPLVLYRYVDFDDDNPKLADLQTEGAPDLWDTADWDVALWDNPNPVPARVRDHFVCSMLALAVEHGSGGGPLTILGLKLEGVPEQ